VPCLNDIEFDPENSRRATERLSSSESTFNPEPSTERSSSSKSAFNPESSRWAMKGSSSSESTRSFKTARESFSDPGGALLYSRNVLVQIMISLDIPLSPGRTV
jgi:hypothetical protein